jgi:hypothetical protein
LSFRRGLRHDAGQLEYRTWGTASVADARQVARTIRARNEAVLRKHASVRV